MNNKSLILKEKIKIKNLTRRMNGINNYALKYYNKKIINLNNVYPKKYQQTNKCKLINNIPSELLLSNGNIYSIKYNKKSQNGLPYCNSCKDFFNKYHQEFSSYYNSKTNNVNTLKTQKNNNLEKIEMDKRVNEILDRIKLETNKKIDKLIKDGNIYNNLKIQNNPKEKKRKDLDINYFINKIL